MEKVHNKEKQNIAQVTGIKIHEDQEFHDCVLEIAIKELSRTFSFGDSLDVTFSNGKSITDVPYYTGYFSKRGEPLICAYPTFQFPQLAENFGTGTWKKFSLTTDTTADIRLNTKAKYLSIQNSRNIVYSNLRDDFSSDEIFSNFRPLHGGHLKDNFIFRGASPCDNKNNRARCTDILLQKAGIAFILNLADTSDKIKSYMDAKDFSSTYFKKLYETGSVALSGLNADFSSDVFRNQLVRDLRTMSRHDGPYYVHCTEGKDRTGFAALLLEGLCGATYDEMARDYMITYKNYYNIDTTTNSAKFTIIREALFDLMILTLADIDKIEDLGKVDFSVCCKNYLRSGGMTDDEINQLINKIS